MALLGGRDTRDLVVWTGVDAAELRKFALADGTNFADVVGRLTGALTAINAEIAGDPLLNYCFITDNPEVTYRMGTNPAFGDADEYTRPDQNRGQVEGHMLPIKAKDLGLGWTWDYLRRANVDQIDADIQTAVGAARTLFRKTVLTRVLKRTDDSGAANGLGTGGYSPGFATTAAQTNVDFTPPEFAGGSFANTHEHYLNAGTYTSANFVTVMKTLREHGHEGPFDVLVSESDESTVRGFSDFVASADPFVQYANTTLASPLGAGYIGYLKDSLARVRRQPGMPANYFTFLKSYGPNNRLNPLRIRVSKGESALRIQAFPNPTAGAPSPANPLSSMVCWAELGVGVGDRTAGATWRNNAAWADGTAS